MSETTSRPMRARGRARRELLLDATIAIIAEGGIAAVTHRSVAAAAGVPLPAAVTALTTTPARTIGRPELGSLAVGAVADAVLLDADLQVRRVFTGTV